MQPVLDRVLKQMIARGIRGSRPLRRLLSAIRTSDEITAVATGGALFQLRPTDYIDWSVLRTGYYETEVLQALLEALPDRGTIWDIGANFGLHAITVKLLRPDVTVVCFEPSPDHAARILRHSELNRAHVTVFCLGLGMTTGPSMLHICPQGNAGLNSFVPWPGVEYDRFIFSYVVPADALLDLVPAPDVIKLDVEGGEAAAISGMSKLLSMKKVKRLIIEHGDALASSIVPHGFQIGRKVPEENFIFDSDT